MWRGVGGGCAGADAGGWVGSGRDAGATMVEFAQLQVMPPPDGNIGSSFSNCTWSGSNGSAVGFAPNTPRAPWGPADSNSSCLITGVNITPSNWNAQWSTVTVPIPSGYTCADSDQSGCWITIAEKFNGAVHDVTSWNAFLLGDPVRLVK